MVDTLRVDSLLVILEVDTIFEYNNILLSYDIYLSLYPVTVSIKNNQHEMWMPVVCVYYIEIYTITVTVLKQIQKSCEAM